MCFTGADCMSRPSGMTTESDMPADLTVLCHMVKKTLRLMQIWRRALSMRK